MPFPLYWEKAYFFVLGIWFSTRDFILILIERRMDMPLWIWFVFIGIVVSAVMSIRTARQERLIEETWIEEEGQKYMERMRIEQEKRRMTENKQFSE